MTQQLPAPRAVPGESSTAWAVGTSSTPDVLSGRDWARRYAARLGATDALVVVLTVSLVLGVKWLLASAPAGSVTEDVLVSGGLAVLWLAVLSWSRTRDRRVVGKGPAEYVRVFSVSWRLFATVAVGAYLADVTTLRDDLVTVLPLGLLGLITGRYAWRRWLHRQRDLGTYQSRVLVVGNEGRIDHLVRELNVTRRAGYRAVAACASGAAGERPGDVAGVPVLGGVGDVARVAVEVGADAVAVTGADDITVETVRQLGWDLEQTGVELIMAPALTDIAGPRVVVSPVTGLPLMHVEAPTFTGTKYLFKTAFDRIGAAVILVLVLPVLLTTALLVGTTSPGPVLYRQMRIGRNGEPFPILKFRSMYTDADARLDEVMGAEGVGLFYKRRDDPRITPVGRFIRQFSIDELPQLINVLRGEMSLVGPRPQIDREVALYDRHAHRRLLVKPGLTGLWQVSGRSSLTPEESIRLDVFYVENWTLFGDFTILGRTLRAVFARDGAY